jgi:ribosomal protein L37AE/L43A
MGWLNGKDHARASVLAPAPAVEAANHSAALVVPDNRNGITTELARFMPVMDIEQAIARRDLIVRAMKSLMKEGVDYGKIPGTDKPALLQPGADKLCNLFGLTLQYDFWEKEEDWSGERHGGEPFFYYQVRARVYRGDFLLGEGVGSCSSWETKYRWRKAERTCPMCGKANIRKSREGGWYCWRKTEGCGTVFQDGDQAIEGQETGRKLNPDIFDAVNTILHARNTQAAASYVAEQKIATGNPHSKAPWKNMGELAKSFQQMREKVGEVAWREELERYSWRSFQDLRNAIDNRAPNAKEKATECYWHLYAIARKEVA